LTEPDVRFDPRRLATKATRSAAGYVLNGVKTMVALGGSSELTLVIAAEEGAGPAAFVVERGQRGVTSEPEHFMGLRPLELCKLSFDNVELPAQSKLKRPSEWVLSMVRATGLRGDPERFARGQALLGEPMWRPPSPKGFADDEGAWIDTMGPRLDIANNFAERVAERIDPKEVVETALGPIASTETRAAVARAESRQQALALAFMSPEFQRR